MRNPRKTSGFIRGKAFLTLLYTGIAFALIYYGTIFGKAYYLRKMSATCSERLWLIEKAKDKYRAKTGRTTGTISHYSELLPFLTFTGFPMCPWGGSYENELSLDKPASCPLNGQRDYEPDTPGVNILRNGYNDLGKPPKNVSLFEFFHEKTQWKGSEKDPNAPKEKKKSSAFES